MSYYEHKLEKATASYDLNTGRAKYIVKYRLLSNDRDDHGQKAIKYVQDYIANFGSSYACGNDSRGSAYLQEIDHEDETGSRDPWVHRVTLTYADPEPQQAGNIDNNGNQTTNPLDFRTEVEVQTVQVMRPLARATYRGGFALTGPAAGLLTVGQKHAVVNSAFAAYDPPAEFEDHQWVCRIRGNLLAVDADTIKCNVVNNRACKINYRGLTKKIPLRAGKTRDVSVVMQRFPGDETAGIAAFDYLTLELFIDVKDDATDPDWWFRLLDAGFDRRALVGDPNGRGGTLAAGDIPKGAPPHTRILSKPDDIPVSQPVLLNGNGQPLIDENGARSGPEVFGEWSRYSEADYLQWDILDGIIEAM